MRLKQGSGAIGPSRMRKHLAEGDLARRHQQRVAAELAALAHDDAVALQLKQDLLEEFAGNALLGSDFADHHRVAGAGERDQGPESIFGFLRDHLGKSVPKLYLIDRVIAALPHRRNVPCGKPYRC